MLRRCAVMRLRAEWPVDVNATVTALRCTARRALALEQEADELQRAITTIVERVAPALVAQPGVGPITAAVIFCAWSQPGRCRSEAAFATLAGVAPIPASSGLTVRYRLNRCGDRQLNRALHTIVTTRLRIDPATADYVSRRTAEGKSRPEIRRCLKRYIARDLYRLLEHPTPTERQRTATAQGRASTTGPKWGLTEHRSIPTWAGWRRGSALPGVVAWIVRDGWKVQGGVVRADPACAS